MAIPGDRDAEVSLELGCGVARRRFRGGPFGSVLPLLQRPLAPSGRAGRRASRINRMSRSDCAASML